NSDLENNYISAAKKGINVIATGDFTHPQWFDELEEKLYEVDNSGLFRLKKDIEDNLKQYIPESASSDIRFMLQSEISSIYKKNGVVRKIHNLLYFPSLESVKKFNSRLDLIGNIKSDGRPILGLDSRDLLEIALETDERAFLVPAHIWTPWFSLFGSKSGFNKLEECFEDLSSEIFALETGLSSDPEMNFLISDLDKYSLISNSDAHSPAKLGREVNIFDCELSFYEIKNALKYKDLKKFKGTFEFFPEEGKYHYDGHRKCNVCLSPGDSLKYKGLCPLCGKPLTLGVLYRIIELSDRTDVDEIKKISAPYYSLVPLTDILSEILGVGPNTKKVKSAYEKITSITGSEFNALWWSEKDELENANIPFLSEAVERVRKKELFINPGYDGEFGKIKIFDENELKKSLVKGQKSFFNEQNYEKFKKNKRAEQDISGAKKLFTQKASDNLKQKNNHEKKFNKEQAQAIESDAKNIIVTAGPGTGKTTCLTSRVFHLIENKKSDPEKILALTFTIKAANEMKDRINEKKYQNSPFIGTFHSFALNFSGNDQTVIIDEDTKKIFIKKIIKETGINKTPSELLRYISLKKQSVSFLNQKDSTYPDLIDKYENLKKSHNFSDYDDILLNFYEKLEDNNFLNTVKKRFDHILIDEYQDINEIQYEIIKKLKDSDKSIFAIGDPDQSVYGFRGGLKDLEKSFKNDFENLKVFKLRQNYRSSKTITDASFYIIRNFGDKKSEDRIYSEITGEKYINIIKSENQNKQSLYIADEIQNLVGGTDHQRMNKLNFKESSGYSFEDIAVLCRTKKETDLISLVLEKNSIPHNKINEKNLTEEKAFKKLFSYLKMIVKEPDISDYILNPFGAKIKTDDLDNPEKCISLIQDKLLFFKENIKNKKLPDIIEYIINNTDMKEFADDYNFIIKSEYLVKKSNSFENINDFLNYIKLNKISDIDFSEEKVSIMTIHSAKGLEFPVVFIPNCVEGNIPFIKNGSSDIDEERRIFYVAVTRAGKKLYLLKPEETQIFGKKTKTTQSSFLKDLEKDIIKEKTIKTQKNDINKKHQLSFF
ncbi:MAG: UvrD-helicase domain-containing protein, partial [Thermodesulfobacteriota bacterium]